MSLPEHLSRGQHVQAPRVVGWRKTIAGMVTSALLVCMLGWVLIPLLLAPAIPPAPADVPASVPTPEPARADLIAAEVSITRVTEPIGASQQGDSSPVDYAVPSVMQPGDVLVQLTSVTASHPSKGWKEVRQASQAFRFELVDALTGDTIGTADVTREDGVDSPPVLLATLTEPRATYLTVSAEVRGDGTCTGCGTDEDFYQRALFNSWGALLQYDEAVR